MSNHEMMYCGRTLSELTKQELVDAITSLYNEIEASRDMSRKLSGIIQMRHQRSRPT